MPATRAPRVFAVVILIIGVVLAVNGVRLMMLGGSLYYALAGVALIVSAVLLWRGDKRGAWLYGALLLATLIWSLFEVGFDAWALAPRLIMLFVLGGWLLLPRTRRALNGGNAAPLWSLRSAQATAAGLLILILIGAWLSRTPSALAIERSPMANAAAFTSSAEWKHYGRTSAGTRYIPFGEIAPRIT